MTSITKEAASNAEDDDDDGEGDAGENDAYATSNSTRNPRRMSNEKKLFCFFISALFYILFHVCVLFFVPRSK